MSFECLLPSPLVWPPGLLCVTSRHPLPSELLSLGSFQGALPFPASEPLSLLFPSPRMLVLCPLQCLILILQFPS